jgi:RNA polymerase sigma factor (sigma-70 family)
MHKKSILGVRLEESSPFLFKQGVTETETDLTVWKAFKHGNRKAFDYIFEKYSRRLYTYGCRFCKNTAVVEDCMQDLFVELWKKRENLSDTTSIHFYLLRSLRRRIVKVLEKDLKSIIFTRTEISPDNYIDFSCEFVWIERETDNQQKSKLQSALNQLSPRQKEAVYLKFYEQMTYESIAAVMGITVESAYALIGKAISVLRQSY